MNITLLYSIGPCVHHLQNFLFATIYEAVDSHLKHQQFSTYREWFVGHSLLTVTKPVCNTEF